MQNVRPFPLNYFQAMFSPRAAFIERRGLTWWQMILVMMMLTSLLLGPISLQIGRQQSASLDDYYPKALSLVNDSVAQHLQGLLNEEGELEIETVSVIDQPEVGNVVITPGNQEVDSLTLTDSVVFTRENYTLYQEGNAVFTQPYSANIPLDDVTTGDQLQEWMSQQWFWSNRPAIIITNMIYTTLLIVGNQALLILGASGFLYLMRRSHLNDFSQFKEVLNFVLNCLGLPSLLAMILGFISGNPIHIIYAQSLLFILMLMAVYYLTRFQDSYALKEKE